MKKLYFKQFTSFFWEAKSKKGTYEIDYFDQCFHLTFTKKRNGNRYKYKGYTFQSMIDVADQIENDDEVK